MRTEGPLSNISMRENPLLPLNMSGDVHRSFDILKDKTIDSLNSLYFPVPKAASIFRLFDSIISVGAEIVGLQGDFKERKIQLFKSKWTALLKQINDYYQEPTIERSIKYFQSVIDYVKEKINDYCESLNHDEDTKKQWREYFTNLKNKIDSFSLEQEYTFSLNSQLTQLISTLQSAVPIEKLDDGDVDPKQEAITKVISSSNYLTEVTNGEPNFEVVYKQLETLGEEFDKYFKSNSTRNTRSMSLFDKLEYSPDGSPVEPSFIIEPEPSDPVENHMKEEDEEEKDDEKPKAKEAESVSYGEEEDIPPKKHDPRIEILQKQGEKLEANLSHELEAVEILKSQVDIIKNEINQRRRMTNELSLSKEDHRAVNELALLTKSRNDLQNEITKLQKTVKTKSEKVEELSKSINKKLSASRNAHETALVNASTEHRYLSELLRLLDDYNDSVKKDIQAAQTIKAELGKTLESRTVVFNTNMLNTEIRRLKSAISKAKQNADFQLKKRSALFSVDKAGSSPESYLDAALIFRTESKIIMNEIERFRKECESLKQKRQKIEPNLKSLRDSKRAKDSVTVEANEVISKEYKKVQTKLREIPVSEKPGELPMVLSQLIARSEFDELQTVWERMEASRQRYSTLPKDSEQAESAAREFGEGKAALEQLGVLDLYNDLGRAHSKLDKTIEVFRKVADRGAAKQAELLRTEGPADDCTFRAAMKAIELKRNGVDVDLDEEIEELLLSSFGSTFDMVSKLKAIDDWATAVLGGSTKIKATDEKVAQAIKTITNQR